MCRLDLVERLAQGGIVVGGHHVDVHHVLERPARGAGRDSSLCRLMPRLANGSSECRSDPGSSSTAITSEVLSGCPRRRVAGADHRELREVLLVGLDPFGEDRQAVDRGGVDARDRGLVRIARARRPARAAPAVSWTGTGSIRIDDRNSSHCASACQCDRARRTSSRRAPGTPSRAWSTRTTSSPTIRSRLVCRQELIGLVDRPRLGVLQRDDPERRLARSSRGRTPGGPYRRAAARRRGTGARTARSL